MLRAGDAATFKAGVANGHHLVNRSGRDALFLEIGTRPDTDRIDYPDIDLVLEYDGDTDRFMHRDGKPYPPR